MALGGLQATLTFCMPASLYEQYCPSVCQCAIGERYTDRGVACLGPLPRRPGLCHPIYPIYTALPHVATNALHKDVHCLKDGAQLMPVQKGREQMYREEGQAGRTSSVVKRQWQ